MTLLDRCRAAARGLAAKPPLTFLIAGWFAFVFGAYPGYLSFDSTMQLMQLRGHSFSDAHAPLMSLVWSVFEYVMAGPFPMLLLQSGLFLFGLAAVLRTVLAPRAAAITAALVLLFPPVFAPMAVIWPDTLMAGALLAATGAALQPSWRWRIAAIALGLLACSCRPAIAPALLPIALLASATWVGRRRLAVAAGIVMGLAGGAWLAERILVDERTYTSEQSLMTMDLIGTLRRARVTADFELDRAFAGLAVVERPLLRARLITGARDALDWYPLVHGKAPIVAAVTTDEAADSLAIAWRRAIADHPRAYFNHRWMMLRHLLGFSGKWVAVYDEFGDRDLLASVSHLATTSDWQTGMRAIVRVAGKTVLFRPWLYLVLAIGAFALAWRWRWSVIRALLASGLVYQLMLGFVAPHPDYRYSHWLVTVTCIAIAVALVTRRAAWRRA